MTGRWDDHAAVTRNPPAPGARWAWSDIEIASFPASQDRYTGLTGPATKGLAGA